jgi:hypothetical protein
MTNEKEMKCRYLIEGRKLSYCGASISLMVPSSHEMQTYCTTEENYRCPILLSLMLRSGGVSKNTRTIERLILENQ